MTVIHLFRDAGGVVRNVTTLSKRDETADEPRIEAPAAPTFEAYDLDRPDGTPAPMVRAREVLDALEPAGTARWKAGARAELRALALNRRPPK